jgi:hypothetical protein
MLCGCTAAVGHHNEADCLHRQLSSARYALADAKLVRDELVRGLRDRFAMAALTGLLAADISMGVHRASAEAYEYADSMLARRARKEGT